MKRAADSDLSMSFGGGGIYGGGTGSGEFAEATSGFGTITLEQKSTLASMADTSMKYVQSVMNDTYQWLSSLNVNWQTLVIYGGLGLLVLAITIGMLIGGIIVLKMLYHWVQKRRAKHNNGNAPMKAAAMTAAAMATAAALRQKAMSNNNNSAAPKPSSSSSSSMGVRAVSGNRVTFLIKNNMVSALSAWATEVWNATVCLIKVLLKPWIYLWHQYQASRGAMALEKFKALVKTPQPMTPAQRESIKAELVSVTPGAIRYLEQQGRVGEANALKMSARSYGIVA